MAYELILSEKLNQDYTGPAEECIFTFTVDLPDQLGVAAWTAESFLDAMIDAILEETENDTLLEYYLYEDDSPTLYTNYLCRVVATDVTGNALSWALIVPLAFLLAIVIWTYFTIKEISELSDYQLSQVSSAVKWIAGAIITGSLVGGLYIINKRMT